MNKKILGAVLALVLIFSQTVVAFATEASARVSCANATCGVASEPVELPNSITVEVTNTVKGVIITHTDDYTDQMSAGADLDVIVMANQTNATDAEVIAALNKIGDVQMGTATFITKFFDVKVLNDKCLNGHFHVPLYVPGLPANATVNNVRALHFSTVRGEWEILEPLHVDGKEVEFIMDDHSPMILYMLDSATSPATGVTGNWALLVATAVVLFAVSTVVAKKRR